MDDVEMYRLRDGRGLAVRETRAGDRRTVVLCHPVPGSGLLDPVPHVTAQRQVTLLAPDRAGYGESDPLPVDTWASVELAADDLAAVLDQRGEPPVGIVGWSAGGVVALALAARRSDLVDRVCAVSTPAPDSEIPWLPEVLRVALGEPECRTPAGARHHLETLLAAYGPEPTAPFEALNFIGGGDVDLAALDDEAEARSRLIEMLRIAFKQGDGGFAAEVAGHHQVPWGFDPAHVVAKTLLINGAKDPVIAGRHANWWHKQLPNSRVEMAPDCGPLTIIRLWKRVLSHLAPSR